MIFTASLCACVRLCVPDRLTTTAAGTASDDQPALHAPDLILMGENSPKKLGTNRAAYGSPFELQPSMTHRRERDNFEDRTTFYVRSASAVRNAPSYAKLVNYGTDPETLSAPGTRAESSSMPETGWYAGLLASWELSTVSLLGQLVSRQRLVTGNRILTIKSTRTRTTLPHRRLCRRCSEDPIHFHSTQSPVYRTKL